MLTLWSLNLTAAATPIGLCIIFGVYFFLFRGFMEHVSRLTETGREPTDDDVRAFTEFFTTAGLGVFMMFIGWLLYGMPAAALMAIIAGFIAGARLNPDAFGLYTTPSER